MNQRRFKQDHGRKAYGKYVEALREQSSTPSLPSIPKLATVIVASCTGLSRLSTSLGVRLCLVAVHDDESDVSELSRRAYGANVPDDGAGIVRSEDGWEDWHVVPLHRDMVRGNKLTSGASLVRGRLKVALTGSVGRAAFSRRLEVLMNDRRYDEALLSGAALRDRQQRDLPLTVPPRYGLAPRCGEKTWVRVKDVYVFDPWQDLPLIATLAVAASLACS